MIDYYFNLINHLIRISHIVVPRIKAIGFTAKESVLQGSFFNQAFDSRWNEKFENSWGRDKYKNPCNDIDQRFDKLNNEPAFHRRINESLSFSLSIKSPFRENVSPPYVRKLVYKIDLDETIK